MFYVHKFFNLQVEFILQSNQFNHEGGYCILRQLYIIKDNAIIYKQIFGKAR